MHLDCKLYFSGFVFAVYWLLRENVSLCLAVCKIWGRLNRGVLVVEFL